MGKVVFVHLKIYCVANEVSSFEETKYYIRKKFCFSFEHNHGCCYIAFCSTVSTMQCCAVSDNKCHCKIFFSRFKYFSQLDVLQVFMHTFKWLILS